MAGDRYARLREKLTEPAPAQDYSTWREEARALLDERDALVAFASWVDSWVSNPATSYSVDALNGLFGLTRDRLEALSRAGRQEEG